MRQSLIVDRTLSLFFTFMLCAAMLCASENGETRKVSYPGGRTYMFRVMLKDKNGTPYSLDKPGEYLSLRAMERRSRQHIGIDSTDLPVNPQYVKSIEDKGVSVICRSKWNNTVLVKTDNPNRIRDVMSLSCVDTVREVFVSPDSINKASARLRYHEELNKWDTVPHSRYGMAHEQIQRIGGTALHSHGFTGKGMVIAVLDGGFMNADVIPCMQKVNILGTRNFVYPEPKSVFQEMEHGTKVLSLMAVNEPETFIGTAPDASYWLLRCEDNTTESMAEEDYWAAAAEFADSVGTDVINSSLGFHNFDAPYSDYTYAQLDGHATLISATASMLADKGIVLVNSAGNDGMGQWKKINVPADADNIITVGAVCPNGKNAAFSSIGPTADGRVKPDVMAPGSPAAVVTGRGTIIMDIGTSFAAPLVTGLVACLWQSQPTKTAKEIIEEVRQTANRASCPDNIYGYGVANFNLAFRTGRVTGRKASGQVTTAAGEVAAQKQTTADKPKLNE